MTVDRYQNSTDYEHPQESNLLNIHKTMQYNSTGQPVARVHVDGITLEGDVLVDTVSLSSSTLAALESINVQNTVSVIVSNFPTTSTVYQGTDPWTIAAQSTDPSIIYLVRNAVGTSTYLNFNNIPNADVNFNFAQIAVNAATENLSVDQQANVQTLGINASATFDLMNYNFRLVPGEYLSVFISSSNAITRTSVGLTWMIE